MCFGSTRSFVDSSTFWKLSGWVSIENLGATVSEAEAGAGAKPGAAKIAVPVLELGGFFETKSEEADSKVVEDFRLALEQGGVLQKVETTQRDTPERSADGKTEQVALKFRMRAEWPVGGVIKGEAAKKPEAK